MEILLKAEKTIVADDESYTMVDGYSGVVTHIFTSKKTGTIYTIKDEDIAGFGEKLTAFRLNRLIGSGDDHVVDDCMFGWYECNSM